MLQIKQLCKEYKTGNFVQKALDHVDLNLRDNEFVAILGPSGSGKTTLLNIIGGLDRYDSGNLIINGISTEKYKDRDWDSYRNHTIGFVFQSYNLIPHQTILSNVELALTISGIGKTERRKKAVEALNKVGLGEQIHKKPNQLSGGQMQRVAIARALVNDPEILLADEPTGALDSNTSIQVMDLLQEVAKDRLVVMVTHNPDLAKQYATRIVNLRDGKIRSDSNPYFLEKSLQKAEHKTMGKSSMSFLTALSLSFNNLRTKKARTLLTAFAGSIGIIGISLILALSTGVNNYIQNVEEETLSQYPLQIQSTGFDFTSMMNLGNDTKNNKKQENSKQIHVIQMVTDMFSKMNSNDLKSLKAYLDSEESNIKQYTNAVEYSYNVVPQIYRQEENGRYRQVNPDKSFAALGLGSSVSTNSMMSSMMGTDVFYEMPENTSLYENQYDVKAGRWPENYNECVVVLTANGSISDFMLYTLGLRDPVELDDMIQQFIDEENITTPEDIGSYSYDDILGITFKLVNSKDYYQYDDEYKVWKDKSENKKYMKKLVKKGEDLTVVGVVQPSKDANGMMLTTGIAYPSSLIKHVSSVAESSEIVQNQLANHDTNVFTNKPFGEENDMDDFDMNSLFHFDEEEFQKAFAFDENQLLSGSFDFSKMQNGKNGSIDFSDMIQIDQLKLPELPQLNMNTLINGVQFTTSGDSLNAITSQVLEGYLEYASKNPETDLSSLRDSFIKYLKTEDAKEILKEDLLNIMEENGTGTVSTDQIKELFKNILSGYQKYAKDNHYTDPDKFDDYLMEYLETKEAQNIIDQWNQDVFSDNASISISDKQLENIAEDISRGYQSYASQNGFPDPSKISDAFSQYLNTDQAQKELSSGITKMINSGTLEKQLTKSVKKYMKQLTGSYADTISDTLEKSISSLMEQIMKQMTTGIQNNMKQAMAEMGNSMSDAMKINPDSLSNAFQMNMDLDDLTELLSTMNGTQNATYDNNLATLGYIDFENPSNIDIYPINFETKEQVVSLLDQYNDRMKQEGKEEQVITYTDMVGTLMSSVTNIIDIISYVLIAFVAISLVVSSIMIGVITYISVLERKKEIGILRAIGASKRNISQVFNAETIIIGFCAGIIGIGLTILLLIPGNAIIHQIAGNTQINASLPVLSACILIALSIFLTFLGGFIPAKKAAKSDPVTALRTE